MICRGEIRWYRFAAPDKRRPVLILTRDSAIPYLNAITVAPITTTIRGVPSEVRLLEEDGVRLPCAINLYNLQTLPKREIGGRIAQISSEKMGEVHSALLFALGFSGSISSANPDAP